MFRKIKFILLAIGLSCGITNCSSDDSNKDMVPEGKEYLVTVTVTEDAVIKKVMGVIYEGNNSKNDFIDDLAVTEWSKVYRKKEKEKISFTAQGIGRSEESKMEIQITSKEGEVVGEAFSEGELLNATVVIDADKKK